MKINLPVCLFALAPVGMLLYKGLPLILEQNQYCFEKSASHHHFVIIFGRNGRLDVLVQLINL